MRVLLLLPILLLAGFISSCKEENAKKATITPGQLQIGVAPPYRPFLQDRPLKGLDVDLARAIARQEKLEPRFRKMSFSALLPALRNKKIDVALAALVETPETSEEIIYSDPYLQRELLLFGQKEEPLGVIDDSVAEGRTQEDTRAFPDRRALADAFLRGEVRGIVIGQNDTAVLPELRDRKPTEREPLGSFYVIALREGSEGLQQSINRSLERLEETGELEKIIIRWLGRHAKK